MQDIGNGGADTQTGYELWVFEGLFQFDLEFGHQFQITCLEYLIGLRGRIRETPISRWQQGDGFLLPRGMNLPPICGGSIVKGKEVVLYPPFHDGKNRCFEFALIDLRIAS